MDCKRFKNFNILPVSSVECEINVIREVKYVVKL